MSVILGNPGKIASQRGSVGYINNMLQTQDVATVSA